MAAFTNIDIKMTRERLKMTAGELGEFISRDPSTVYNFESGKADPSPDDMYLIALAFGDLNIWYDWMRTRYPGSYGRLHPDAGNYGLQGCVMNAMSQIKDVIGMENAIDRAAASGSIEDPALKEKFLSEVNEALGALQRLANTIK